jgi:uncharacterized protein (TIGR02001 family)
MKKLATIGFTALMAAGIAGAQDDMVMTGMPPAASTEPEVTAAAALFSSYVWRGQVYNNDLVIQPEITVSQYDFSLNVWANYDLAGSSTFGVSDDISELDLSLAYTLPIDINQLSFDVGVIYYSYPNTPNSTGTGAYPSTVELYGRATVTSFEDLEVPVIPSLTLFGDVDEVNGTYVLFDIHVPYDISDVLSVAGGISVGWGNTSYNDYYFPNDPVNSTQDAGFNDYNFYGLASYELTENVTAQASATYTLLEGGSIRNAAENIYDAEEKFWVGAGIAYDF